MSTPVIRVVAAVVSRVDELLVGQRPPGKRHAGLLEFPGGKCERGEPMSTAIGRELREELDVEVIEIGTAELTVHDPGSPYLIVFVPVRIAGEPVCREHSALRWGRPRELIELPLAPSDRQYVSFRLQALD